MSSKSKLSYSEAGKLGYLKSKAVHEKNKQDRLEKYALNPKRCPVCSTPFEYEKRTNTFCGHKCAAIHNNTGVNRHARHRGKSGKFTTDVKDINTTVRVKVIKACLNCGQPTMTAKYCKPSCQAAHRYALQKAEVEKTGVFKWVASQGFPKRYLLETRGHKCEICKTEKWMGKPIGLIMDHIDGNSSNNTVKNIRFVCGNCDMQLPTYKSKNRGNGRHQRNQRYAAGKSY